MGGRKRRSVTVVLIAIGGLVGAVELRGQQAARQGDGTDQPARTSTNRPLINPPKTEKEHPLAWVLKYTHEEQAYLRWKVRDFTCRLIKRERIEGSLQEYRYIDMRVREELYSNNQVVQPFSVFMEFLGPTSISGRKILFVHGENDNKMRVRKGGARFSYVVVDLNPYGETARQESPVPITEIDFQHMLGRTIRILEHDMAADPSGENTSVQHIKGATINGRQCDVIRISHPQQRDGLEYHIANVFVDSELHVPVRTDAFGWPGPTDAVPPLLLEFTYTDLKLNVDLRDAAFDFKLVGGN